MKYTYQDGRHDIVVRIEYSDILGILIIIIFCCMFICLVFVIIIVTFYRGNQTIERQRRMSVSSLNRIPTRTFVEGDEANGNVCCVCQEEFKVGDLLRILP